MTTAIGGTSRWRSKRWCPSSRRNWRNGWDSTRSLWAITWVCPNSLRIRSRRCMSRGRPIPRVRQRGTSDADVGGSKRHYPARPNILDGAVVMGAVATHTTTLKMGPSVLIAPYRHPLSDARQFATIDTLSQGRLIMGVGAGWMKEEFDALDRPFDSRLAQLEEAIQVYKSAWTDDLANVPRPVLQLRPDRDGPEAGAEAAPPHYRGSGDEGRGAPRSAGRPTALTRS